MKADGPEIIHGDCIEVMLGMGDSTVDAIVTDPPYGLGFMGKQWDGLPPGQDWAEECLRVLKPGGYLLAFGGTRTWHKLAGVIDDAGFEMRDSIAWLYGTGMPKGPNLKPAFEPIVMARKPFSGSLSANVATHGTGALSVDECRTDAGRWPANVTLDEYSAGLLDGQSGISATRPAKAALSGEGSGSGVARNASSYKTSAIAAIGYEDTGGASRFLYVAKASKQERPVVDGITHPTVKPIALMRWLVRLVTPVGGTVLEPFAGSGATVEACLLEGFHCIAIEREAEYLPLIHERIQRVA